MKEIDTDYTVPDDDIEDIKILPTTTGPITITFPAPIKGKIIRIKSYSYCPVIIEGAKVMNEHDFAEFKAREISKENSIWEFE